MLRRLSCDFLKPRREMIKMFDVIRLLLCCSGSKPRKYIPRRHNGGEVFFVTKRKVEDMLQEVERWTILRDNHLCFFYDGYDLEYKEKFDLKGCAIENQIGQATMKIVSPDATEILVYLTAHLSLVEATEVTKQLMVACGNADVSFQQHEVEEGVKDKTVKTQGLLAEYSVLDIIGEGSFARIHRARHKHSEKIYAMKIIDWTKMKAKGMTGTCRAERDAMVLGRGHPFILQLHSAFRDEFNCYFITELCSGSDFSKLLSKQKRLDEHIAAFYVAELVIAVEHLHHLNVIHRDVKLSNVYVHEDGHVRLGDFGFAKVAASQSRRADDDIEAETLCGTYGYIAPEMYSDVAYGKEVDWWSLGCVVMLMLCGKRLGRLFQKELHESFGKDMLPSSLSPEARDLIGSLLHRTPEQRLGFHGAADVKAHPFFKGTDWVAVKEGRVTPPPVPISVAAPSKASGGLGRHSSVPVLALPGDDEEEVESVSGGHRGRGEAGKGKHGVYGRGRKGRRESAPALQTLDSFGAQADMAGGASRRVAKQESIPVFETPEKRHGKPPKSGGDKKSRDSDDRRSVRSRHSSRNLHSHRHRRRSGGETRLEERVGEVINEDPNAPLVVSQRVRPQRQTSGKKHRESDSWVDFVG